MAPKQKGRRRLPPWVGPWLRERRTDPKSGSGAQMDDIMRRLRRSKSAVSRIETGLAIISADDLPLVLKAYGLSLDDFSRRAKDAA